MLHIHFSADNLVISSVSKGQYVYLCNFIFFYFKIVNLSSFETTKYVVISILS